MLQTPVSEIELDFIRTRLACKQCSRTKGFFSVEELPHTVQKELLNINLVSDEDCNAVRCFACDPINNTTRKNTHSLSNAEEPQAKRRNVQTDVVRHLLVGEPTVTEWNNNTGESCEQCNQLKHKFNSTCQSQILNSMACDHCDIKFISRIGFSCKNCHRYVSNMD